MTEELFFEGNRYISARDAAVSSKFTRDYIARLAREGKIVGRQIGRQWYVSENSLQEFLVDQEHANEYRRSALVQERLQEYGRVSTNPTILENSLPYATAAEVSAAQKPQAIHHKIASAVVRTGAHAVAKASDFANQTASHIPLYAVSPGVELLHKVAAAVLAVVLVVGLYTAGTTSLSASPAIISNASGSSALAAGAGTTGDVFSNIANTFRVGIENLFSPLFDGGFAGSASSTGVVYVQITQRNANVSPVATVTSAPQKSPTQQSQTTLQTIIERQPTIIQPIIQQIPAAQPQLLANANFVTQDEYSSGISQLENSLKQLIFQNMSAPNSLPASGGYTNEIAASQSINNLTNTTINNPTITGGTITGIDIAASSLSGVIGLGQGGTGTSTSPTYGQLLLGNQAGGYDLVATSSLGIQSGGGTWGSITGVLSNQTDLQSALDAKADIVSPVFSGTAQFVNASFGGSATSSFDSAGNLVLAGSLSGAGLTSCNGTFDKLSYNSSIGQFGCSADQTSGGGGAGAWATTTNSLAIFPSNTSYVVLVGENATTTTGNSFEVAGNSLFRNAVTAYGGVVASSFSATSTASSTFTNATFSGNASTSNLVVSNGFTLGNLNGFLKATAGSIGTSLVNLASDVTGILPITAGGTGTSSAPSLGQILVGNGSGGYNLVSTSSLGFTGGTWGSITGTLSNQTDLQNALNAKLSLTDWYATTTDGVKEGINNLYFTPNRVASVIAGTTTDALAQGSTNKYYSSLLFASDLAATTTDALRQGTTNKYFSNTLAQAAISITGLPLTYSGGVLGINQANGSTNGFLASSDWTNFNNKVSSTSLSAVYPLAYNPASGVFTLGFGTTTANTYSQLQIFTSGASTTNLTISNASNGFLQTNSSGVVSATSTFSAANLFGILGVSNGGTGTSAAPTFGQVLVGNGIGGYNLVSTSSLGISGGGGGSGTVTSIIAGTGLTGGTITTSGTIALDLSRANSWTGLQVFGNASSSNLSVFSNAYFGGSATSSFNSAGQLTLAGLTSSLLAVNGSGQVVATSSVSASNLFGILGVGNGGTGTSSAPAYGQFLIGNGSGGYNYFATSSLGFLASSSISGTGVISYNGSTGAIGTQPGTFGGSGTYTFPGDLLITGNSTTSGNIMPSVNDTYTLGSPLFSWKSVYIGPGSLFVNGQEVIHTDNSQNVVVSSNVNENLELQTSGTANVLLNPTGSGQIQLSGPVQVSGGKNVTTSDSSALLVPFGVAAGNLTVSGNTLQATNTNGGISITPAGNGGSYFTNGNVGIGTTIPGSRLEVEGLVTASYFSATSTTATSTFANGLNLTGGCFALGGNCLTLGSFGGTINLASQVTGTLGVANGGTGATSFSAYPLVGNGTGALVASSTLWLAGINATSTTATSTIGTGGFTVGSNYFVVQQGSGNVGIGTLSPTHNLEVNGTGAFSNTLAIGSVISCTGSNALQTDGSGTISCGTIASGGSSTGGGWTTNNTGKVSLSTTTDLVAIGATSTPYAKLSVISGSSATTTFALVPSAAQTANIIDIYAPGGGLSSVFTSAGFLGIGTTSPQTALAVTGSGYLTGGLGVGLLNTSAGTLQTSAGAIIGGNLIVNGTGTSTFAGSGSFANLALTNNSGLLKASGGGYIVNAVPGTDYQAPGTYLTSLGNYSTTTGTAISLSTSTQSFNGLTIGQSIGVAASGINFTPTVSGTLNNTGLTNSTIGGTSPNSTLTFGAAAALGGNLSADLNLNHSNFFTALQNFTNASSTNFSVFSNAYFGGSATSSFNSAGQLTLAGITSSLLKTNGSNQVVAATPGTDYQVPLTFTYPLLNTSNVISEAWGTTTANTWSQLQTFTSGFNALASSTIGNGTQISGLTINGGATTTGNAYFAGNVGVGTSTAPQLLFLGGNEGFETDANGATSANIYGYKYVTGVPTIRQQIQFGTDNTLKIYSGTNGLAATFDGSQNLTLVANESVGGKLLTTGFVGIGTTTPNANLSIFAAVGGTNTALFNIASSTGIATTTLFSVSNTGTTTIANGVNITAGCFSLNGTCLSAATSLLSSSNTWTGLQTFANASSTNLSVFSNAYFGGSATSSFNNAGQLALAGITSSLLKTNGSNQVVAATPGTDYQAPITASYPILFSTNNLSLAFGTTTANTWSQLQTFAAGFNSLASSTIGDGTQTGGLTINGGATTTGIAYFANNLGIGTSSPGNALTVHGNFSVDNLGGTQGYSYIGQPISNGGAPNASDNFLVASTSLGGSLRTSSFSALLNGGTGGNVTVQALNAVAIVNSGVTGNITTTAQGGSPRNRYLSENLLSGYNVNTQSAISAQAQTAGTLASTTNAIDFNAEAPLVNSGNLVTNFYHFLAKGGSVSGTLTNNYGLYIEDMLSGTNRYGVYQAGASDSNYFAGSVGIGTTSPAARFSIAGAPLGTTALLSISTSTASATTTVFSIDQNGNTTIGNNGSVLTINGATTTAANGFNILTGCFAVNGTCLSAAASLLSSANTWTALQNFSNASSTNLSVFSNAYFGGSATSSFNSAGQLTLAGITSSLLKTNGSNQVVAATPGTDYQAPITASYPILFSTNNLSLAFGTTTANTWSQLQTLGGGFLSQASSTIVGTFTTTGANIFGGALTVNGATSTFANGISLTTGCIFYNGSCVGANSGTVNGGLQGQVPYYATNGTTLTATSSLFINPLGYVGVGTTTPGLVAGANQYLTLASTGNNTLPSLELAGSTNSGNGTLARISFFNQSGSTENAQISSAITNDTAKGTLIFSTANDAAPAEAMRIDPLGNIGIATNTPGSILSINGVGNFVANATSTLYNGINVTSGCVSVNGNCLGLGSVTSITTGTGLTGGTITTTGTIALDLTHANSWTGLQTFANASSTLQTNSALWLPNVTTNSLLKTNANGQVAAAIAGTDYQAPITASYPILFSANNLSLAFGTTTANTWSQLQTFTSGFLSSASSTIGNGTQITGLTISGGATTTGSLAITGTTGTTSIAAGQGFTIGASQFLVQQSSGNVGIGTTAPGQKLDIAGNINVSAGSAYMYNGSNVIIASTTLSNYFFGGAGNLTMTGSFNTGGGPSALVSVTSGAEETAFGYSALHAVTTGTLNSAFGMYGLNALTTGSGNIAIGYQALVTDTTGSNNTAIGVDTLEDLNLTANNGTGANTAIGSNTGRGLVTGINNTIIGANVNGLASTLSNNIIIADGAGNQRINVGSTGNLGIGTTSPFAKFSISANSNDTNTTLFAIASSTASATTTLFSVGNTGSTTIANGVNITAGCFAINGTCLTSASSITASYPIIFSGNNLSLAFGTTTANTWSQLQMFTSGFISSASSTIGNGTQIGGLTVNGGATTTGTAYFASNVGIGISNPGSLLDVNGFVNTNGTSGGYKIDGNLILQASTTNFSTIIGQTAGTLLTSAANYNTSLGYQTLFFATSSLQNTAIGARALVGSATVSNTGNNTAIGYSTLTSNASGNNNTALGVFALTANTSGSFNIAAGVNSLLFNQIGQNNSAFGYNSLQNGTSTSDNVAIGFNALAGNATNFTGNQNVAVGENALSAVTTGSNNVGVGFQALLSNQSGADNFGLGTQALWLNKTGSFNTALGFQSLLNNTTGSNNTSIGTIASLYNNSATNTIAIGYQAGQGQSAFNNQGSVSIGNAAGFNFQTGSDFNTLLGYQSGYNVTSGSNNILIGAATSSNAIANLTSGSQNILIGTNISLPSPTLSGQLNIGNLIFGTGLTGTGSTISSGNIGIGTNNPTNTLDVNGTTFLEQSLTLGTDLFSGGHFQSSLSGNAAAPTYSFVYGSGVGMFLAGGAGSNTLGFSTNGLERMRIDQSGNVSIGTTTTLSNLTIQNNFGSTNANIFQIASSTASSGVTQNNFLSVSATGFGTTTLAGLNINGSATSTSNVGINITAGCFAVAGTCIGGGSSASSTLLTDSNTFTGKNMFLASTTIGNGTQAGGLTISGSATTTGSLAITGTTGTTSIAAGQGFTIGASQLVLQQGSGNFGIGTANPNRLLNVVGGSSGAANILLELRSNAATANTGTAVLFTNSTTAGSANGQGELTVTRQADSSGVFSLALANASPVLVTDFTITGSNGNVGIGTTSPFAKLSVSANSNDTNTTLFAIASSTANATTTLFSISNTGTLNITPYMTSSSETILQLGGVQFLAASTTGQNTSLGYQAGLNLVATSSTSVTSATDNTSFGYQALEHATSTSNNIAIGVQALFGNATNFSGNSNVGIGDFSLFGVTTGSKNVGIGFSAISNDTTGSFNFGLGAQTLQNNTSGSDNQGIGNFVMFANTTGGQNTAIGSAALTSSVTGSNNLALGYEASDFNISATNTVAIGYSSYFGNSAAYHAQGYTAVGYQSGFKAQTGSDYNTFLGYQAGYNITTGSNNIWVGTATSSTAIANLTSGSQNILIGNNISLPSPTLSGQLNIGNIIFGTGITSTGSTLSSGSIGIGTSSPFATFSIQTQTNGNAFGIANSIGSTTVQISTVNTANNIFEVASSTGSAFFDITAAGNVGIGTTSPLSTFGVVGSGCFSVGGSATLSCGTTAGNLYYTAANTGNYDVAEDYVTSDASAMPGTIVGLDDVNFESVTTATSSENVLGVVSTNPGLILGGADALTANEHVLPIALSGRVPVKVSLGNGPISIGDRLALSSTTPGVAVKALQTGETIGMALEAATSSSSMIDVFVQSQFIVVPPSSTASSTAATSSATTVASSFFANATVTLQQEITSLGSTLVQLFQNAVYATTGIFNKIYAQEVHTDKLCVSDSAGETCLSRAQLNSLLANAGTAASGGNSGGSSSGTPSGNGTQVSTSASPTLSITGNNPAIITVGTSYSDLGATITAPQADLNLGIAVSVDSGATTTEDQIQIDTSVPGTHTIQYSATDQNGLTSTVTRTVNVVPASGGDDTGDASSTGATSTTP